MPTQNGLVDAREVLADGLSVEPATVEKPLPAWGQCSSEEALYISNDIAQTDPEPAGKGTREANLDRWNNKVKPERFRQNCKPRQWIYSTAE